MTLNWYETAADCRVAEYLTPLVLRQFNAETSGWSIKWSVRPDHTYDMIDTIRVTRNLDHLLTDLAELLPEGRFWKRTTHRLLVPHGRYQIRQVLESYLRSLDRGNPCLCSGQCRYPSAP